MEQPPSELWSRYPIWDFVERINWAYHTSGRLPLTVTSWYRNDAHNRAVGGVPGSLHTLGLAIDVVGPSTRWGSSSAIEDFQFQCERAYLATIRYTTHVHVQYWAMGEGDR